VCIVNRFLSVSQIIGSVQANTITNFIGRTKRWFIESTCVKKCTWKKQVLLWKICLLLLFYESYLPLLYWESCLLLGIRYRNHRGSFHIDEIVKNVARVFSSVQCSHITNESKARWSVELWSQLGWRTKKQFRLGHSIQVQAILRRDWV
jgi:hypothetical protein